MHQSDIVMDPNKTTPSSKETPNKGGRTNNTQIPQFFPSQIQRSQGQNSDYPRTSQEGDPTPTSSISKDYDKDLKSYEMLKLKTASALSLFEEVKKFPNKNADIENIKSFVLKKASLKPKLDHYKAQTLEFCKGKPSYNYLVALTEKLKKNSYSTMEDDLNQEFPVQLTTFEELESEVSRILEKKYLEQRYAEDDKKTLDDKLNKKPNKKLIDLIDDYFKVKLIKEELLILIEITRPLKRNNLLLKRSIIQNKKLEQQFPLYSVVKKLIQKATESPSVVKYKFEKKIKKKIATFQKQLEKLDEFVQNFYQLQKDSIDNQKWMETCELLNGVMFYHPAIDEAREYYADIVVRDSINGKSQKSKNQQMEIEKEAE